MKIFKKIITSKDLSIRLSDTKGAYLITLTVPMELP